MSPRKQVIKASRALPSAGDGDCVEVDDTDEEMFPEELPQSSMSSSRRRERVVKAKPKEMTEEEMMDLALRLSEQEASIAAAKRQQEDEAMTEALKESMFSQTQPCASPLSQRYHGNTDLSPKLPSRRKLAYPAAAAACCGDVVLVDEPAATEPSVEPDPRGAGNHKHNKRKRKREDGVALPERPDLPETQKICSQSSALENPCSQTDPCQLPKTFKPSSPASKLHVHLSRLSPETLKTCTTSGFILCSQQSLTSTPTSLPSPSKSPTFPGSATHSDNVGHSKKPTFPKSTDYCSDPDVEEIGETNPRFHCPKSPVFGRVESTKASYNTNTKSPVFGRVESTRASDDTGIAPKSPVFGRVVSTRASDYETQIAASDTSQKSLATCDDDASPPEGLKSSKLSRSKRQMHSASHTASKGLMFPKCPASTGKERPGDAKDMWSDGCSVKTQDCRTSPPFGKGRQVSAETSPDSGEESPRFGKTSLPKNRSGLSSPGLGGTSPVFGRTSPVFGRTSSVFGSTRTEKSSILPATIGQESSSQDSHSASSRPASAISNKESRQPPQCLQKTNGLNHKDGESESTSGDPVSKPATAALAGRKKCPKSDEESIPETMKMTSDMTSRRSDSEEDSEQSEVPPSPVFPEERRLQPAAEPKRSPEQAGSALPAPASPSPKRMRSSPVPAAPRAVVTAGSDPSPTCRPRGPRSGPGPSQEPPGRAPSLPAGARGEPLVHYYWGVPFCPQGLDPDGYTQVILAQMEVYEKSLKSAQRDLLRKAEWGDAITPQAEEPLEDSPELIPTISLGRPGLRSRRRASGVKLSREEEEEEEDEGSQAEEVEREAGEPAEEGEEDLDVVGCDVCPETQLSGELTPDPGTGEAAGPAETQPDSPSLLQSLPRSRGEEAKEEEEEEEEEEETHTPDLNKKEEEGEAGEGGASEQPAVMSPSREQAPQSGQQQQEQEEEEETETQGAVGAEERKEAGPAAAASSVDCPICQGAFPASEIEMHAAFCDGDQEVVECPPEEDSPVSHRPSKRRALKSLATEERGDPSGHAPASRGREKCYVCHKSFPSAEYARHTESCLQRAGPPAAAPPKGDLLAALETTERRHPGGPSLSRPPGAPRDVIDLSHNEEEEEEDEEDEEGGGGGGQPATFRVSDSPIRAFKSISEASDSLVDFRRQNAPREPGQRARGRRGGAGGAGGGGGGRGGGLKRKFKRR